LWPYARHWIAGRPGFFLSVRVLSRLFRRLFLERLTAAYQAGRLVFFADQAVLAAPAIFRAHLAALRKVEWVVYAKRPFGGPDAVLAYLSLYTHRVPFANSRLVAFDGERVAFNNRAGSRHADLCPRRRLPLPPAPALRGKKLPAPNWCSSPGSARRPPRSCGAAPTAPTSC
jgi:hypothetical protein